VDYDGLQKTMFNGTGVVHQDFPAPMASWGADNEDPVQARRRQGQGAAGQPPESRTGFKRDDGRHQPERNRANCRPSLQNTMAKAGVNLIIKMADKQDDADQVSRPASTTSIWARWGSGTIRIRIPTRTGYLNAPLAKRKRLAVSGAGKRPSSRRATKKGFPPKRTQMYMDLQKMAVGRKPLRHPVPAG